EQFTSEKHDKMLDSSFSYNVLDLDSMAMDQGDGKSLEQYLIDIALAILVAALLAYIMFSLMSFIPEVASSLVSQGTRAGQQIVKAEVFGEAVTMMTLELAKEASMAVVSGGSSAAKSFAEAAAKAAAKSAAGGGR